MHDEGLQLCFYRKLFTKSLNIDTNIFFLDKIEPCRNVNIVLCIQLFNENDLNLQKKLDGTKHYQLTIQMKCNQSLKLLSGIINKTVYTFASKIVSMRKNFKERKRNGKLVLNMKLDKTTSILFIQLL